MFRAHIPFHCSLSLSYFCTKMCVIYYIFTALFYFIIHQILVYKTRFGVHILYFTGFNYYLFASILFCCRGQDSIVGIAICSGLDGPGIESRWRQDFPHPSDQPPISWVLGHSRGANWLWLVLTVHLHLSLRLQKE
jgi:hypothetical protein